MRIISKRKLREFWHSNPLSEKPLLDWYRSVKNADWGNFSDIRNSFRHSDVYKDCVVFDIGGNKFRLIAKVRYPLQRVYVRFVLSHREYDKDLWKEDCEC